MGIRFYIAALLTLSFADLAHGQNRVPVYVWFKYGGTNQIRCGNALEVAKTVAKALSESIKPYQFIEGSSETVSHLRFELSRETSQNMSVSGYLYGYSVAGGPAANADRQGPFELGAASYANGLPPCTDWINKIPAIVTAPAALNQLKSDLLKNMPFAKGIRVLNPPPPLPRSAVDARLLILAPLAPEFASSGQFEVEYDQTKRMLVLGVACTTDNLVVVEPPWTEVTTKNVDYAKLNGNSKDLLIYAYAAPSRRVVPCNADTQAIPSPVPSALPRPGNP